MRRATLLVALLAGCTETHWTALPYPIPLTESGSSGGLMGAGSFYTDSAVLPTVIDTGTVLTTYDDGSGTATAPRGNLTLFGIADGTPIPRLHLDYVQFFQSKLGQLGVGDDAISVGAVFAGDNLSRFAATFDYRGAAPSMTVMANLQPCSCEFQPQPGAAGCSARFDCTADLSFALAGGQNSALQSQTRVIVGNNQYTYPPTRVLLDTCVEPYPDPLTTSVPGLPDYAVCTSDATVCPAPPYMPAGVDARMLVASGFPGLALSESAYDRLRGTGATAALFASGATVLLHLPDDSGGAGVEVAETTLGRVASMGDPGAAALALVSHEFYFGPCASLARSRRVRRARLAGGVEIHGCELDTYRKCSSGGQPAAVDPFSHACDSATADARCSDEPRGTNKKPPTPAVIELAASIPVFVLKDVSPLLVGINADLRPAEATVEGVIGTSVLERLVSTIDYPGNRFLARCAGDDNCKAYPRLSLPDLIAGACDGFCHGPDDFAASCPGAFSACTVAP